MIHVNHGSGEPDFIEKHWETSVAFPKSGNTFNDLARADGEVRYAVVDVNVAQPIENFCESCANKSPVE